MNVLFSVELFKIRSGVGSSLKIGTHYLRTRIGEAVHAPLKGRLLDTRDLVTHTDILNWQDTGCSSKNSGQIFLYSLYIKHYFPKRKCHFIANEMAKEVHYAVSQTDPRLSRCA